MSCEGLVFVIYLMALECNIKAICYFQNVYSYHLCR